MSNTATSRSCSILELPRRIEAWSKVIATSRSLELGSNSGGSNMMPASRLVVATNTDGNGAAMRLEALGAGERHGGWGEACKSTLVKTQNRGALHEVEHTQARGETSTARRRQHVVGARHIVADHFGCVGAQEDRPRVTDPLRNALRIRGGDLDMLGSDAVGQRRSVGERAKYDDRSEGLPAGAGDVAARQSGELALDGRLDVGHENGLRRSVVFGLGQQVSSEPLGVVVSIGDNEHF